MKRKKLKLFSKSKFTFGTAYSLVGSPAGRIEKMKVFTENS